MARIKGSPKMHSPRSKRRKSFRVFTIGKKKYKLTTGLLKTIKKLQLTVTHCIPKSPFSRVIREICQNFNPKYGDFRIQSLALEALHEAAEMYLTGLFEDANICAAHAKRLTVRPDDVKLSLVIRGTNDPGRI